MIANQDARTEVGTPSRVERSVKLGVVLYRNTYYRHLGPVIEAALARGWEVTCLHYREEAAAAGAKAYQILGDAPHATFTSGVPGVQSFYTIALPDAIAAQFDAIVSMHGPRETAQPPVVPWLTVQHGIDYFCTSPESLLLSDANCILSDYWSSWYIDNFALLNQTPAAPGVEEQFRTKCKATGFVALDAFARIDRDEVRHRLGLPDGKAVVTYLPSSPCAHQKLTSWCRWIYSEPKRHRQALNALVRLRSLRALQAPLRGWNNQATVGAVRRFCDRNNAVMLVKTRLKTRPTAYESAAADVVCVDESFYPPSFLEILAVSNLVIGYHSTSVLECAHAGVPYVLIDLPQPDSVYQLELQASLENGESPALWRCDGFITRLTLADVLRRLPHARIAEFNFAESARQRYVETILGSTDGKSGDRVLDVAQSLTLRGALAAREVGE